MNPKLTEILKKAKAVEQRANQMGNPKNGGTQTMVPTLTETMGSQQTVTPTLTETMGLPTSKPQPKIDVNSEVYRQKVNESNLPPEIRKAMLENPIQQADSPGTFSMDEESIKEINPNYGKQTITEDSIHSTTTKSSVTVNNSEIRKMIAEEIAKALPGIVEKYFDKKMIQENIRTLKSLRITKKKTK
jgi:hypothetical protein